MDYAILVLGDLLDPSMGGSPQNLDWGSWGTLSVWGWIGLVLTLVFWIGLLVGLTLLVVWAIRRTRVQATTVPYASGQPTEFGSNHPNSG